MKNKSLLKFKAFPYAVPIKKGKQQWNSLAKLSIHQKRFFKNKSRFFSMEFGRSFTKRILWQVVIPPYEVWGSPYSSLYMKHMQTSLKQKNFFYDNAALETISLRVPPVPFQHSWRVLRSILFGKMWALSNPSLVPGVVRPVKTKKVLLTKMRAFKALTHLVGNYRHRFLVKTLQKLWALSSQTVSSLWSIARGLNSFQTMTVQKSGFIPTIPAAIQSFSINKVLLNGEGAFVKNECPLNFSYPGDFFKINEKQKKMPFFVKKANALGEIFTYGPTVKRPHKQQLFLESVHLTKPFLWLSVFYSKGTVVSFSGKNQKKQKHSMKHRFLKKQITLKNKHNF